MVQCIKMGGSSIAASAIIMGCMRIGEKSPQDVNTLIAKSLELGINTFDHADLYGGGASEEVFAKAMALGQVKREEIVLQSKCGICPGYYDLSKEHIMTSAEQILKRLHTDYLDVLLLHRPDTLMEPEEVAAAFDELHTSGKVKAFGVSNMNSMQIEYLQSCLPWKLIINQLQFGAAHTGMVDSGLNVNMRKEAGIDRDGSVLEYCRMRDITIQTWSSLQYGFFEGTFLNNEKYPELNQVLERIAEENNTTAGAAAIAWILRHPAKMQAVIGTTNAERLGKIAEASRINLTRQEWYEIYCAAGNVLP
ncbi:MAG: aldo/keto reductase [Lachnospiraceae bacterium]